MATYRQLQDMTTAIAGVPGEDYREQTGRALNERYQTLSSLLPLRIKTTTITVTANLSGAYNLVDDFGVEDVAEVRNAYYTTTSDGRSVLLVSVSDAQMFSLRTIASTPITSWFAAPDWNTIMLYPNPTTGDTLTLEYAARVVPLNEDDDEPDALPPELHTTLAHGAVVDIAGVKRPSIIPTYQGLWDRGVGRAKAWNTTRIAGGTGEVVVGRGVTVSSLPDVYPGRWN